MTTYSMTAEENFDAERIAAIAGLTTYFHTYMGTDQNYQGIQWDAVRRNLMYMYCENIPATPISNTTGHTLWDGNRIVAPDGLVDPGIMFNSSVGVKNLDTGVVTFYNNYDVDNVVPVGISDGLGHSSDGTWRRFTNDFKAAAPPNSGNNGPGMTDPNTGDFWINGESCELYCFRLTDDYSLTISPLRPVIDPDNIVQIVGFTDDWSYAREIDQTNVDTTIPGLARLYLTPRVRTAADVTADKLLVYATFTYPRTEVPSYYHSYNREVFDHAGNMYVASCASSGDKDFQLHRFEEPSSAPFGGPVVGGGFTDITPWSSSTGPNGDADDYTLDRQAGEGAPNTADIIPMYLPVSDDIVLIEKFFPTEHTADSVDPALMSWSCTYVSDPSGTPAFDHHSAFVTGYMTEEWAPTDISGAAFAVIDAFEVNTYLGQSSYNYTYDYTKRWFFFLCTKMTAGVSDGKSRIVLVEYSFVNGVAPAVLQVIDEQGWDDTYPDYAEHSNDAYGTSSSAAVATAMQTILNEDRLNPQWDSGIYDPVTTSFWWSGGGTNAAGSTPFFSLFDDQFVDRTQDILYRPSGLSYVGATPPFMKLSFGEEEEGETSGDITIRCWAFSLDDHDFYVLRLGANETLIYDLKTEQWSSWESPGKTNWRLHVGQNWVGYTALGENNTDIIAGDDTLGVLWVLDAESGIDERPDSSGLTDTFTRIVTGGVSVVGRNNIPCGAVTMDVALGNPVQVGARIHLEISDDFGHTWLDCGTITVPAADYSKTIEWRALGLIRAPGRIFRFTDSGATVRISGANMR